MNKTVLFLTICIIMASGCKKIPSEIKNIIGVYKGEIIYSEPGKNSFVIHGQEVTVKIFSDENPASSGFRVLLKINSFDIPDVYIEFKKDSVLSFPIMTTEHNISVENKLTLLSKGECTADIGYPIPFPIYITGKILNSEIELELLISSSFGNGKKITFEGEKKKINSFRTYVENHLFYNEHLPEISDLGY